MKPTVGLALIARDEQDILPRLLHSIEGAFDQIVLVDTGSEDDTVKVFERWADAQSLPLGHKVDRISWPDDFAAARNHALAACTGDWILSVDADEIVHGEPAWLHAMLTACGEELDALSVEIDNSSAPDVAAGSHRELKLFRRTACRLR